MIPLPINQRKITKRNFKLPRLKGKGEGSLVFQMGGIGRTNSETAFFKRRGFSFSKQIGEGAFSKIVLSTYNWIEETHPRSINLACKILDIDALPTDFVVKFLPRELEIMAKLDHPYVVKTHCIIQRRNKIYIFMRHAESGDLLQYLQQHGELNEDQAYVWFRQLALAVQYLHTMDIVHRDLKCENILLTAHMNVKLSDFGFARHVACSSKPSCPVLSATFCGSLTTLAPEVVRGLPYEPKAADVWSLGCILFIMLNRAPPFDDYNERHMYEQQMARDLKYNKKIFLSLSTNVKRLVSAMLEPDLERYRRPTINEVLEFKWLKRGMKTPLNEKESLSLFNAKTVNHDLVPIIRQTSEDTYLFGQMATQDPRSFESEISALNKFSRR